MTERHIEYRIEEDFLANIQHEVKETVGSGKVVGVTGRGQRLLYLIGTDDHAAQPSLNAEELADIPPEALEERYSDLKRATGWLD